MYRFNYNNLPNDLMKEVLTFMAVVFVFSLIVRVLLLLAVRADTRAIAVKNATLWTVLVFFIPITGLIYLAVRNNLEKSAPRMCTACGATMPPNTTLCMNCGSPALLDYKVTGEENLKKTRRAFLIAAIAVYILLFLYSQIWAVSYAQKVIQWTNNENSGGYSQFDDDFGREFDEDFDDFFDEFNNFGNEN